MLCVLAAGCENAGNESMEGADTGAEVSECADLVMHPMGDDPDSGYVDITDHCVAEINTYREMEGLEPFWIKEDGLCCSAQEAHQAVLEGTPHNGDFCDWQAQGSAGGGRGENGTVEKSVDWVPKLFYQEKGDTFEESGGHYQAMMRPEPRAVACGYYAESRDQHRIMVNYW